MTLWTIQSIAAWKILQREQVLFADQRYSEDLFLDAYRWMAKQMERRIESEPEITSLPLWAWYQWEVKDVNPIYAGVLIYPKANAVYESNSSNQTKEFAIRFDLWHYVLQLLVSSLEPWPMEKHLRPSCLNTICLFFDAKPLPVRAYHQRIEDSWDRIFDLDWAEEEISDPFS